MAVRYREGITLWAIDTVAEDGRFLLRYSFPLDGKSRWLFAPKDFSTKTLKLTVKLDLLSGELIRTTPTGQAAFRDFLLDLGPLETVNYHQWTANPPMTINSRQSGRPIATERPFWQLHCLSMAKGKMRSFALTHASRDDVLKLQTHLSGLIAAGQAVVRHFEEETREKFAQGHRTTADASPAELVEAWTEAKPRLLADLPAPPPPLSPVRVIRRVFSIAGALLVVGLLAWASMSAAKSAYLRAMLADDAVERITTANGLRCRVYQFGHSLLPRRFPFDSIVLRTITVPVRNAENRYYPSFTFERGMVVSYLRPDTTEAHTLVAPVYLPTAVAVKEGFGDGIQTRDISRRDDLRELVEPDC